MKQITKLTLLVLFASLIPQLALSAEDDLEAGFKLGKFYVSTKLLAMELDIIQTFSEKFKMVDITQENFDNEVISDKELEAAELCLAYTLWRLQYFIIPLCEEGLDGDALDSEYLGDLREQTEPLLTSLRVDSNICLISEDFVAVAEYANAIAKNSYVTKLTGLAQAAKGMVDGDPETEEVE